VDFQASLRRAGSTNADLIHNLRNHEPVPEAGRTDADLIRNLRDHLLNDNSKNGLAHDLFPLTSEEQKDYDFKLLGQEVEAGRNVYHIAFAPRTRKNQPGRAKHSSMPRNSSPFGCSPECRGASPIWCGRCVRSAWIRVQRGLRAPGRRSVVSFDLRNRVPAPRGPLFFFNRDVSISLENSGLNMRRWRPVTVVGRDLASISEMEVGNFDLPRFLEQNSADL